MQTANNTVHDDYDLLSPEVVADPYPLYDRMRAEDPVHWSEIYGCWLLTRYEDVLQSLRDKRLSNARRVTQYIDRLDENVRKQIQPVRTYTSAMVQFTDPPDHTRIRPLVSKAFTPRMVRGMRPRIQEITDYLLDEVQGAGRMDAIREFAYPLPIIVISEMVGIPSEERDQIKGWASDFVAFIGTGRAEEEETQRVLRSLDQMTDYIRSIVVERRESPKDDLLSALIAAEDEGDRLTEDEIIGTCVSLMIAGHETTTNLIGNGILALLKNPDQLRELKADPDLIVTAIEEILRYDGPVLRDWSVAMEDHEVGGKHIREGQIVYQMLGAANRDPEQFDDPDRLILSRHPNRHVTFGSGFHMCLGAPLARLEGQIAVQTVFSRFPEVRLTDETLDWEPNVVIRALKSLPLSL